MKVSACTIAKNEEKNIRRCLESMQGFVDELIVVDTGSEDRTIEVARACGAKVYQVQWENDFSKAKNYAIDKAVGDWIIFLDADEYFADDVSIKNAFKYMEMHQDNDINALLCRIVNIDSDSDDQEIMSFSNLRIFRNLPNLRYRYEIHEELYNKNGHVNMAMVAHEVDIYHTGYSSHIIKRKLQRNLDILLEDIELNGENNRHYRYLVDCYQGLGEYEKAIKYAKLHIASGEIVIGGQNAVYEKLISSMLVSNQPFDETKKAIKEAISVSPEEPIFYFFYAFLSINSENYDIALKFFFKALARTNKKNLMSADSFQNKFCIIYTWMGEIYAMKNARKEALRYFKEALRTFKYNPLSLKGFCRVSIFEPEDETIAFLNQIYTIEKQRDMEFLVKILGELPVTKVYAYYHEILSERFKSELPSARQLSLLSSQEYEVLYKEQSLPIQVNLSVLATCLIADHDESMALEQCETLSSDYAQVVYAYYNKSTLGSASQFVVYKQIFEALILLRSPVIPRFIACCAPFSIRQKRQLAVILINHRLYQEAISVYRMIQDNQIMEADCSIWGEMGICFYYLHEYDDAKLYFEKVEKYKTLQGMFKQLYIWCEDKKQIV